MKIPIFCLSMLKIPTVVPLPLKSFCSYGPKVKNFKDLRKKSRKRKKKFWPIIAKIDHCGSSILKKFLLVWAKSQKL